MIKKFNVNKRYFDTDSSLTSPRLKRPWMC